MPQRRRVVVATSSAAKVPEIARALAEYDIECDQCVSLPEDPEEAQAVATKILHSRSETSWNKAIFRETMRLYESPRYGLEGFQRREREGGEFATLAADPLPDGLPIIIHSRLEVFMLPTSEEAVMREQKATAQSAALHTHPITTGQDSMVESSQMADGKLRICVYSHAVEGYVDWSKRTSSDIFGWDDIVVLVQTAATYQELLLRGRKFSPRDVNVSKWLIQHIHYKARKATNFINESSKGFSQTVQFDDDHSVAAFVRSNEYFNNSIAVSSGLRDMFVAVANNGAFFRSAHTRREVNYWLPGLNAGIPFVAKKDPIHEITFTAHDFGHFLIPDLVYTGNNTANARRIYILYRMMSEATTMVMADMLFVETLRLSGYEYDWSKRKIHPLFQDTGLTPFAGTRGDFFEAVRKLLEANVAYCLLGDCSKYVALIEAHRGSKLDGGTCHSLEAFKTKYMPFFVEDYRWTTANFNNMSKRASEFRRWWELAQPIVEDAGLSGMSNGIGLETVDDFMRAVGVSNDMEISSQELIQRVFTHTFESRFVPVFSQPGAYELAPPEICLKNAYGRYLVGQMILFARFDFVPESQSVGIKLIQLFKACTSDGFTEARVETSRSLYAQFLRTLLSRAMITPDDAENWQQICPLFDPVYVFYDEQKEFYKQLSEVQEEILRG